MFDKKLVAAVAAGAAVAAYACTGMYAGKMVSEDGTVLLGRTVDSAPWTACHRYVVTPRVENMPGRVFRSTRKHFRWALPATTWKYVGTPTVSVMGHGVMDSACANERGFVITGTVTAHPNAKILEVDPFMRHTGTGEESLPGLLSLCCSTVQEALKMIETVIAQCGHTNGEIYMIADKDEAWYVEVYSGHQWAAVKMPEDKVACWGNQFMIGSFDPASPDTRHSKGLIAVAEKAGTLVKGEDGLIDLRRSYAAPLGDYSNFRTWFGHKTFSPSTAGQYAVGRYMPLFYAPARKIGYRDMFELMRSRYEGTDRNPEENNLQKVRVIGTTKQTTSHVISLDPSLPAPLRGTIWASLANSEHSVFMPLNAAITRCDEAFTLDQTEGPYRYDARFAGHAFRRLCALAERNRKWYGGGVREFWREREDIYLKRYPGLLAKVAEEWKGDPAAAAERITAFTVEAQRKDFAAAHGIFDELMWYVMANNRIVGDGSGATAEPKEPFRVVGSW